VKVVPHTVRATLAKAAVEHFTGPEMATAFEAAGFAPAHGESKLIRARAFLRELDAHTDQWSLVEPMIAAIVQASWPVVGTEPRDRTQARKRYCKRYAPPASRLRTAG